TMTPFHHPSPCPIPWYRLPLGLFLPLPSFVGDVGCVTILQHRLSDFLAVVAFIPTKVLRLLNRWLWRFDWHRCQRRCHQLVVGPIRTAHRQPQRNTLAVRQQRAFRPLFRPIRWVFAGFFSLPTEPWSYSRP